MPKILALANQKGGVGKSTIAVHLAAALSRKGQRTLLVDLDHQANATAAFAVDVDPQDTAAQWLPGHPQRPRVREVSELPGLSVLPSYVTLADDEYEAIEAHVSPGAIAGQLRDLCDPYDWVVMDLPPSLAFWSRVGYAAADRVLIPVEPARFSYIGLRQLLARIESIRLRQNPRLRVLGIVASRVDVRTYQGREFREMLTNVVDHNVVFETFVPMAAAIVNAQGYAATVFDAEPSGRAAQSFAQLEAEVLARWDA